MDLIALTLIGAITYIGCILAVELLFDYGVIKLIRKHIVGIFVKSVLKDD